MGPQLAWLGTTSLVLSLATVLSSLSAAVGFNGGVGFAFDPTGCCFDPAGSIPELLGGGTGAGGLGCEGEELLRPSNIPTSAPTPPSAD